MKFIVDRIEDQTIVLEDENMNIVNLDKSDICFKVCEGDVVVLENGKYILDKDATLKRKSEIEEIVKDLWEE